MFWAKHLYAVCSGRAIPGVLGVAHGLTYWSRSDGLGPIKFYESRQRLLRYSNLGQNKVNITGT